MVEERLLIGFGYRVITARSGEQAVDSVVADPNIDLVLMDIDLGNGIDGTEAAARILSHRDLPLIFLSSHTEPEYVRLTESITSYGYIVKDSGATVLDASIKMAFRLFDSRLKEKEHEAALRKDRERTQALLDAIPDLMFVFDREGVIVDYNIGDPSQLFTTPESFLHRPLREYFPEALTRLTLEKLDLVFGTGEPQLYHYTLEQRGQITHYESRLVLSGDSQALAIVRDISDQKRNEMRLLNQNAHLEAIFANTHDAMVFFDTEHRISNANARFTELFGHELADVRGLNINTVVDPEGTQPEYLSPRVLQGESPTLEGTRYTKDGKPCSVSIKGGPVVVDGEIVGGYAIYSERNAP
ncbi:MAG: PAS domain S-box protein [Spirochaetaceae bacterium]|nr:MAG: PAS domain S-box protein [Spirochaetaceae bacterium]